MALHTVEESTNGGSALHYNSTFDLSSLSHIEDNYISRLHKAGRGMIYPNLDLISAE